MKNLWKTSLSAVMLAGAVFASPAAAYVPNGTGLNNAGAATSASKSSLDLAIVNDEKLIESFVKRGLLSKNASELEKQKFLKNYLTIKGQSAKTKQTDPLAAKVKAGEAKKQKKFKGFNNGLLNGKGEKNGHLKGNPDPVSESPNNKPVRKDKVLVLTVEYADFEHNKIKPEETDNYYKDYPLSHYEDMIFGSDGVKGPNGENLVSMKQFYEQQSGGTYTVDGKAYGWLKVPGTAAFYGADANTGHDNVSPGGSRLLVRDTYLAAKAAGIPLQDYDLEDPHDLDGDGNLLEPDGLVDHLMIIHAGMGQEAGGGSLGDNAIWSHRSAVFYDPDGLGNGLPGFYDYTMMPEDGATGVFAHEYGHDLGLPDEYDTIYSGTGEAVAYWSIMASGSWAGKIPGAEPTGFSPFAKEYFQSYLGGNWSDDLTTIDFKDVTTKGTQFLLDQSNSPNGKNTNMVKVNLPQKGMKINEPATGSYEYWGGQKDESDTNMVTDVDLTGKTSATLTFDAWYDIEEQWDFAFVQVSTDGGTTWKSLGNEHTRSDVTSQGYPTILNSMPGFTGNSKGWQAQSFDLSDYKGQKIKLRLRYATDWASSQEGFYADNIKVVADGKTILEDGAEAASSFMLNGFTKSDGIKYGDHYYLLEWRNHAGVDKGLANIKRGNSLMSYDGGLVVWYVDPTYADNWTGIHPGKGFLGVVDAHPATDMKWNVFGKDPVQASTRYHIADAAFGLNPTSGLNLIYPTQTLNLGSQERETLFNDSNSYLNPFMPDAGRDIGNYGLKIRVNTQATDKSVGGIVIYK
ncbi:immune inhibitor A domain-containing protein [Bacillus sp. B-jedd]|uniref:immune inhibitor A domain-containing protein n=1 Tax=Bacillus sp. B-jedd TaxID=1476857 RepID=UPI000515691F|nr:immune inhibitor A domain-containing protein [Bacillus sp. B-jedd]CEG28477.1 M6 family metalloendopeptidase [Bacillus sp. B-jedd]